MPQKIFMGELNRDNVGWRAGRQSPSGSFVYLTFWASLTTNLFRYEGDPINVDDSFFLLIRNFDIVYY